MTDKQIKKYCEGLDCAICNEKEPCIYKVANELEEKLQAKEQECEAYKMEAEEGIEINAELKAENEELKKKLDFQKNMYECARADESDKFEEILELKQTLKEVKYIAEAITNGTHFSDDVEDHLKELAKLILQKINEVEDGNKILR